MSHLHQLLRHPPNAIGRRGAVLLMLGLAWVAVGVNVAVGPPPFRPPGVVYLFELIPKPVRIAGWVGTALIGIVCAFRRTPGDDAAGYVALVLMPLTRLVGYAWSAVLYAVGPDGTGSPSAAGSAVVWAVVVGLVLTIAGWEEYPPYIPPPEDPTPAVAPVSESVIGTLLNFVGGIIGGLIILAGGRFAARQSRQAAEATAAVESRRVDGEEWERVLAALHAEIARANENADRATKSAERTSTENEGLRRRVQELEDREDEQRDVLMVHAAWDHLATNTLRTAGVNLDPPPALTLPSPRTTT